MAAVPRVPIQTDTDAQETQEWLDALGAVIQQQGAERAHYLIEKQIEFARAAGINVPYAANTAYVNTIPPDQEARSSGDHRLEDRIRSYVRWNALAMVLRANKGDSNLGGHIASFASAATLYDVGYNHFWRAPADGFGGDLVFVQGHSSPGVYARAFMLGRLTEEQMDHFRQEVSGNGLSSYPHPWLMPDFWQFPTVSMGLGPIQAIFQARFMKYLEDRGLANTEGRKVWCFLGDGEVDEPESLGAIGLAAREQLDNLIFVINCNSGTRGQFPGCGLECDQADLGQLLGPIARTRPPRAASQADGRMRRWRLSDLQVEGRRVCARALFRKIPGTEGTGRELVG